MRMRKRKPSLRVGLPVLAIGIMMISVGYFGVQPLQNGRPPACFPESCPSLVLFAILGLAGFFVTLWGGGETIAGFLIREGLLEYHTWYWAGWKRKSIRKPFMLLLSADLRGKLSPEEWKILLTFYFLHLKPRLRIVLRYFWSVIGGFMLIPVGGILANLEYGLQGGRFYGQFIAGPAALVLLILILPLGKKLTLRWDRWVAEEVGQRPLLDLFKKIDSFQLPRVENAKKRQGWTLHLWPMPNITERIQNLTID